MYLHLFTRNIFVILNTPNSIVLPTGIFRKHFSSNHLPDGHPVESFNDWNYVIVFIKRRQNSSGNVLTMLWLGYHYNDVIMSAIASQITSLTIVYTRRRSKKISKLRVTGLLEGNSPVTGEIPPQGAISAEKVSICWRHHVSSVFCATKEAFAIIQVCS